MIPIVKALVAGLLAWLAFAAVGAAVFMLSSLWPWPVILDVLRTWLAVLGVLIFLGAPLPALLVALIVLLRSDNEC